MKTKTYPERFKTERLSAEDMQVIRGGATQSHQLIRNNAHIQNQIKDVIKVQQVGGIGVIKRTSYEIGRRSS